MKASGEKVKCRNFGDLVFLFSFFFFLAFRVAIVKEHENTPLKHMMVSSELVCMYEIQ